MVSDPYLIDSVSQSINTATNIIAQANVNKKTREWNEKMYGVQRADALADWTRQNEYNSPTSQMARLREAGLNPNLVYGKGADNTSDAVRSSNAPSWNPRAPESRINAGQSLLLAADLAIKQATADNLKVQNTVLDQDKLLKMAQTRATLAGAGLGELDLDVKTSLRDTNIDFRKGELQKLYADTKYTLDHNERQAAMQAPNLAKAMEEVLTIKLARTKIPHEIEHIKALIELAGRDSRLKELDIALKEKGVQPHDNIFFRVLARLIEQWMEDPKKIPIKLPGGNWKVIGINPNDSLREEMNRRYRKK